MLMSKSDYTFWNRNNEFVETMKHGMTRKRCHFYSEYKTLLIASFAAAHPQVVPNTIELCLTLSRCTLLYNTRIKTHNYSADWIDLEKSSTSITIINIDRQLGKGTGKCTSKGVKEHVINRKCVFAFPNRQGPC